RHGIDGTVGRHERRHDQCAAGERTGIAERGDADVDLRTLADERRHFSRDEDGGDIAGPEPGVPYIDAHAVEHRLQRLFGKGRVADGIAAALETDDKAVADELVRAHALNV